MMRRSLFYRKRSIIVLLVAFVTSCADNFMGEDHPSSKLSLKADLIDWDQMDYSCTRGVNSDTIDYQFIPVTSDDGEEYALTVVTEKNDAFQSATRGTILETTSLKNTPALVYAYINGDGIEDSVYINGNTYTIGNDYSWLPTASGARLEWPSPTQVVTFYGIIPATYKSNYNVSDKSLRFTQNTTAESQTDLLVAATDPLNRVKDAVHSVGGVDEPKPVNLEFRHALTAVNIKANSSELPSVTLTSVQIEGLSYSGTYSLPTGNGAGTWTPDVATATFTASPSVSSVSSSTNTVLNDGNHTFLMIPQSLSSTKRLVLNVKVGSAAKKLTASLAGMPAWKPGTKVTYLLGRKPTTGYYLYTNLYSHGSAWESISADYGYQTSGGQYVYVTSYSLTVSGSSVSKTNRPWKLWWSPNNDSYSLGANNTAFTDNTGKRVYRTEGNVYGSGNSNASEYFRMSKVSSENKYTYGGTRLTIGDSIVTLNHGTSTVVDLSKTNVFDGTTHQMTTANCYIVNGIGAWKFPIVYGNAYKNGNDNTAAYMDGSTKLFVDYAGSAISSPKITFPTNAKAQVLWIDNDISDVIESPTNLTIIQASGDTPAYIQFNVKASAKAAPLTNRVVPGNAVIGLVSGTTVIWQWHIYFHISDQNTRDLGYTIAGNTVSNNGGSIYFRIRQVDGSGNPLASSPQCNVSLSYSGNTSDGSMNVRSLNYAWGNPRPLLADYHATPSYPVTSSWSYPVETKNASSKNKWRPTKTIMDPCPVGYKVPSQSDWESIHIDEDALFKLGWVLSDGTVLSIPYNTSNSTSAGTGYYHSSTASSSGYYRIYVNTEKTIHGQTVSSAPTKGMIHPIVDDAQ